MKFKKYNIFMFEGVELRDLQEFINFERYDTILLGINQYILIPKELKQFFDVTVEAKKEEKEDTEVEDQVHTSERV